MTTSNSSQLLRLVQRISSDNDAAQEMNAEVFEDSKLIKILSFIAVLYTPASLIAVSLT